MCAKKMGSRQMRKGFILLLCCLGMSSRPTSAADVTIRGAAQVRGTVEYAINSTKPVHVFRAVPYAKPPVEDMRFKAPGEMDWWTGVRNASAPSPICPQQGVSSSRMTEDCLTLDIYTPTINPNDSLAIQIWIHGGAFKEGTSSGHQGIAMATYEDVIFVSINYRLGILGFLSSNSPEAPGNQGLWDQRQAFKWVKENIKPFGGDPDKITISGESAGSIAVSAHILSPKTEGLFQRAISQSGTATAADRVALLKQELPKTLLLAQSLGCCTNCTESGLDDYIACLRNATVVQILARQSIMSPEPLIDNSYIPDNPYNMYTQGKFRNVPYLIGFNGDEGANFYDGVITSKSRLKDLVKQYTSDFYPENVDGIVNAAVPLYVDGRENDQDRAVAYSDFIGDLRYIGPSNDVARKHAKVAPTFMYRFAHRPSSSTRQQWASAGHADEIQYTQGEPFVNHGSASYVEDERTLSRNIMRYWANFIKSGSPNSGGGTPLQWPQFDCKDKVYLNLGQDGQLTIQKSYMTDRMYAWAETIPKLDSFRNNNQTIWKCDPTGTSGAMTLFTLNMSYAFIIIFVNFL